MHHPSIAVSPSNRPIARQPEAGRDVEVDGSLVTVLRLCRVIGLFEDVLGETRVVLDVVDEEALVMRDSVVLELGRPICLREGTVELIGDVEVVKLGQGDAVLSPGEFLETLELGLRELTIDLIGGKLVDMGDGDVVLSPEELLELLDLGLLEETVDFIKDVEVVGFGEGDVVLSKEELLETLELGIREGTVDLIEDKLVDLGDGDAVLSTEELLAMLISAQLMNSSWGPQPRHPTPSDPTPQLFPKKYQREKVV